MGWQDGTPVEKPAWMQGTPVGKIVPPAEPERKLSTDITKNIWGSVTEPLAYLGSSMVAKPMGELAGMGTAVYDYLSGNRDLMPADNASQMRDAVTKAFTYEPRTQVGAGIVESPLNPINVIGKVVGGVSKGAGDVVRGEGNDATTLRGAAGNLVQEAIPQSLALLGVKKAPAVANAVDNKIVAPVANAARAVSEYAYPSPGKVAVRAAGELAPQVIAELKKGASPYGGIPGMPITPGQASVGANSAEFAALQKLVEQHHPSIFTGPKGVASVQNALIRRELERLAGGPTQESAITSTAAAKNAMRQDWLPKYQAELAAANTAGKLLPDLQGKADALSGAAAAKVADVRRLSGAQQTAESLAQSGASNLNPANRPQVNVGLPRVGADMSYGSEVAKRAGVAAQKAADDSLILGEGGRFAQRQADSLAAAGLRPIDTKTLNSRIQGILDDTSIAGNSAAERAVRNVVGEVNKWAAKNRGTPDAAALHSIRRNAVESAVRKELSGASENAVKAQAARLIGKISPAIDDAIVAAGGTQWKAVLQEWARGEHGLSQQKLSAALMGQMDKNPQAVLDAIRGNAPQVVEDAFGPGKYSIGKEMGPKMDTLNRVADAIQRQTDYEGLAQAGMSNLRKDGIAPLELPPQGFFNPKISAARSILNRTFRSGMETTLKRMGPMMKDNPQAFAQFMEKASAPQKQALIEALIKRRMAEAAAAGTPSAAQGER